MGRGESRSSHGSLQNSTFKEACMAILKMRGTSFSVLEMESAVAHSDVVLKSLEDLTPLRAARAVTLLGWLSRHRLLLLTAQNFEKFEKNGWSREALEQTTDDL